MRDPRQTARQFQEALNKLFHDDPWFDSYLSPIIVALEQRERLVVALEAMLTSDYADEAGVPSDEFGQHCLYCSFDSESYLTEVKHDPDCAVILARAALAAVKEAPPVPTPDEKEWMKGENDDN